jgi:hypothetical protein
MAAPVACHTVVKGTGRGASCTARRISRTPLTAKNRTVSQTPGGVVEDGVTARARFGTASDYKGGAPGALEGRHRRGLEWPLAGTLQVYPLTASKPASRRRAPRLSVLRRGTVKGRLAHAITVVDLSMTGCLVRCGTLLKPGAILDFEMTLDDGPLVAKVRVADASVDGAGAEAADDTSGCLAGLAFLGLPPLEDARLRRFLDEERRRRRGADASSR